MCFFRDALKENVELLKSNPNLADNLRSPLGVSVNEIMLCKLSLVKDSTFNIYEIKDPHLNQIKKWYEDKLTLSDFDSVDVTSNVTSIFTTLSAKNISPEKRNELIFKMSEFTCPQIVFVLEKVGHDIFRHECFLGKPFIELQNKTITMLQSLSENMSKEVKHGITRFSNSCLISRYLKIKTFESNQCNFIKSI